MPHRTAWPHLRRRGWPRPQPYWRWSFLRGYPTTGTFHSIPFRSLCICINYRMFHPFNTRSTFYHKLYNQAQTPQVIASPEFYVSRHLFGGRWRATEFYLTSTFRSWDVLSFLGTCQTIQLAGPALLRNKRVTFSISTLLCVHIPCSNFAFSIYLTDTFVYRRYPRDNSMDSGTMVMLCIHMVCHCITIANFLVHKYCLLR